MHDIPSHCQGQPFPIEVLFIKYVKNAIAGKHGLFIESTLLTLIKNESSALDFKGNAEGVHF